MAEFKEHLKSFVTGSRTFVATVWHVIDENKAASFGAGCVLLVLGWLMNFTLAIVVLVLGWMTLSYAVYDRLESKPAFLRRLGALTASVCMAVVLSLVVWIFWPQDDSDRQFREDVSAKLDQLLGRPVAAPQLAPPQAQAAPEKNPQPPPVVSRPKPLGPKQEISATPATTPVKPRIAFEWGAIPHEDFRSIPYIRSINNTAEMIAQPNIYLTGIQRWSQNQRQFVQFNPYLASMFVQIGSGVRILMPDGEAGGEPFKIVPGAGKPSPTASAGHPSGPPRRWVLPLGGDHGYLNFEIDAEWKLFVALISGDDNFKGIVDLRKHILERGYLGSVCFETKAGIVTVQDQCRTK